MRDGKQTLQKPEIRPCVECGRKTRPAWMKIANAPGTVVRKGALCTTCADRRLHGQVLEARVETKPLTADEATVVALIRRRVTDEKEAAEVVAMLGLDREEVA